jgi:hypothetical protein
MSLSCPNCGSSPEPEDVYCGTCGHPVEVLAAQITEPRPASAQGRAEWPERRTSRNGQAGPRRGPAPAAPGPVRPALGTVRASARPTAGDDVRVHAANPRDQAESGVAAADPQSHITADDRRMGYAALGVSETLDPLSSSRYLWQLARRFALYWVVTSVIDLSLMVVAILITLVTGNLGALANGGGPFGAVAVIDLLVSAGLMAMFLFMPVPALLGQWSRVLTFQAPAAGSALDHARQALCRHGTPHDKLGIRPLSPPGERRRNYLELRRGYFAGYISCFPHGHDLYVGWTFWIYISPYRLFLARIGRRFQDYTGRGNDMYQTLRYEPARATIAALHTCTLEGVDAATGGTPPADESEVVR